MSTQSPVPLISAPRDESGERFAYKRLYDWQSRLTTFLQQAQRNNEYVFAWEPQKGKTCGELAGGAIIAVIGYDFYSFFREHFQTWSQAQEFVASLGYGTIRDLLDDYFVQRSAVFARRGDLILLPGTSEFGPTFAEVMAVADPPYAWAVGKQGLGRVHLRHALTSFMIGS